ncbi:MAG: hypothetical protein OIN84_00975 [Candidatus Methanoperedens sp.]|nr:MAG: hypothetical protein F9K14_03270 [Candidatus Methanoperedens sp.]MBZ0175252.1 hypothetical protein [Candidatus Methanoperedens nitroreducens]MCX9076526.1 hypothetical protein [Candidatus Methanoperedens sp.]
MSDTANHAESRLDRCLDPSTHAPQGQRNAVASLYTAEVVPRDEDAQKQMFYSVHAKGISRAARPAIIKELRANLKLSPNYRESIKRREFHNQLWQGGDSTTDILF